MPYVPAMVGKVIPARKASGWPVVAYLTPPSETNWEGEQTLTGAGICGSVVEEAGIGVGIENCATSVVCAPLATPESPYGTKLSIPPDQTAAQLQISSQRVRIADACSCEVRTGEKAIPDARQ